MKFVETLPFEFEVDKRAPSTVHGKNFETTPIFRDGFPGQIRIMNDVTQGFEQSTQRAALDCFDVQRIPAEVRLLHLFLCGSTENPLSFFL